MQLLLARLNNLTNSYTAFLFPINNFSIKLNFRVHKALLVQNSFLINKRENSRKSRNLNYCKKLNTKAFDVRNVSEFMKFVRWCISKL